MSLESVKSLVARVSKDAQYRQEFVSNPEEVLSRYDLTVEERDAISRMGLGLGIETKAKVEPLSSWV